MTTRRASSLPLITKCPAAQQTPEVKLVSGGPEADLGTATHAIGARWIATGQPDEQDVEYLSTAWEVPRDELGMLSRLLWSCWEIIQPHFPEPRLEWPLAAALPDGRILTGHADVLSVADGMARVCDWKTGRLADDHGPQLRAYAWLALQSHPECTDAYAAVVRVRDRMVHGEGFTRADLDAWAERLCETLAARDTYNPGLHCGYCPRAAECPAKARMIRQHAAELMVVDWDILLTGEITGRLGADLLDRCKMLEAITAKVRALVKASVQAAGGTLATGDGRQLEIVRQEQRRIRYTEGWPVLRDTGLISQQLTDCIVLPKEPVETAVKALAPRGRKGAAVQELYERLDEMGAMMTTTVERLEVRRAPQPQEVLTHDAEHTASVDGGPEPGPGHSHEPRHCVDQSR